MSFFNVVLQAKNQCEQCGLRSAELMTCPCHQAFYCSTSCQMENWAVHKTKCTAAKKGQAALRSCAYCAATSMHLKSCPCGTVMYCNVNCQRSHWGVHRKMCTSWSVSYRRPITTRESETQTDESCSDLIIADKAQRPFSGMIDISVFVDESTNNQGGGSAVRTGSRLTRRSISAHRLSVRPDGHRKDSDTLSASRSSRHSSGLDVEMYAKEQRELHHDDVVRIELLENEETTRALIRQQEEGAFNALLRDSRLATVASGSAAIAEVETKQRAIISAEYTTWANKVKAPQDEQS